MLLNKYVRQFQKELLIYVMIRLLKKLLLLLIQYLKNNLIIQIFHKHCLRKNKYKWPKLYSKFRIVISRLSGKILGSLLKSLKRVDKKELNIHSHRRFLD